jgi:hypothetical protein
MSDTIEWRYIDWIPEIPKDKYRVFTSGIVMYKDTRYGKWHEAKRKRTKSGFVSVSLHGEEAVVKRNPARLVLWAFKTKKFCTTNIVYKDGDPTNCHIDNIDWDGYSDEYENEKWAFIDWIPEIPKDKYKVSNYGRVINVSKQQLLTQTMSNNRLVVALNDLPRTVITAAVARLVATAFVDIVGYDKNWLDVINLKKQGDVPEYLFNHADNIRWTAPQSDKPLSDFIPDVPEEWKYITWLEEVDPTVYKVSNYGRVINVKTNRLVTTHVDYSIPDHPFCEVALSKDVKGKKVYHASLPRLVAIAFLPKPVLDIKHLVVQPKDGVYTNVRYDNLKWIVAGTHANNYGGLSPEEAITFVKFVNDHLYDHVNNVEFQEFINENFSGLGKKKAITYFRELGNYGQPELMDEIRRKNIRRQISESDFAIIVEYLTKNHGSVKKAFNDLNDKFTFAQIHHVKTKCLKSDEYKDIREKWVDHKIKAVKIVDLHTGEETIYSSISEAAKGISAEMAAVSRAIHHSYVIKKQYRAYFINDKNSADKLCPEKIYVYDVDENLIDTYDSITECLNNMNITRNHLYTHLDSPRPDKQGFIFRSSKKTN